MAVDTRQALASALKKARNQKAVTQAELSDRSGCHFSYISEIERGLSKPSFETVVKLTDALGISLHDLVDIFEKERRGDTV
jgi:transcriptional regulator with XRE-family HTH domain